MKLVRADQTLADVVGANPASARVLDTFGLDYCCGGNQAIEDACTEIGADLGIVLDALSELDEQGPEAWSSIGAAHLVDHVESTHHAYLHAEFPQLDELMAKVLSVHADRHPELRGVETAYNAVRDDLLPHLRKEEQVLFPMIRELAAATQLPSFHCGSIRNPISMMLAEHDTAGDLLTVLRTETGNYHPPDDACASYRVLFARLKELEEDTHLHIYKENSVLFPAVAALEDRLNGSAS